MTELLQKISVCIIMKNEEKHIGKCLEKLKDFGFGKEGVNGEIVLVDTGSSDKSVDVAKEYIDDVLSYKWENDFSKAKNYAVSKAANDLVLIIDADEYMCRLNLDEVNDFILKSQTVIGRIRRNNFTNEGGVQIDETERLFNRRYFTFSGRIHEQVVSKNGKNFNYASVDMEIDHDGYIGSEQELTDKALRNEKLLLEDYKDNPENTYTLFQLGQGRLLMKDFTEAEKWFSKGLEYNLDPKLTYVQMMVTGYGQCLMNNDRNNEALNLAGIYDDMSFCPDYVFMMGQIYMNNNMLLEAYQEFIKCLSMNGERTKGVTSFFPLHNIGVINEMLGEIESAKIFYKKAAAFGYSRSIMRLEELGE